MQNLFNQKEYKELVNKIGLSFLNARQNAIKAINTELTLSNWNVGKYIVEYEQKGNIKIFLPYYIKLKRLNIEIR